jgi:putative polyhydroxyalkanoate system protein
VGRRAAHPFFRCDAGREAANLNDSVDRARKRDRASNGSKLKIKRQHSLGVDEARHRVDQVAEELGGKLGLTSEWEGDHLRVHGKGVSGRILVSNDSVEVHVHVGFAMMMLREPIRSAIENSIDHYIA